MNRVLDLGLTGKQHPQGPGAKGNVLLPILNIKTC